MITNNFISSMAEDVIGQSAFNYSVTVFIVEVGLLIQAMIEGKSTDDIKQLVISLVGQRTLGGKHNGQ